jgi:hypothetical protein
MEKTVRTIFLILLVITVTLSFVDCKEDNDNCCNCTSQFIQKNVLIPKTSNEIAYLMIKENKLVLYVLFNAFIPQYNWYYICNEDKISSTIINEVKTNGSVDVLVNGNIRQLKIGEVSIHESEYDRNTYDIEIISIRKVTK